MLFLFQETIPDEASDLIHEMVYPLWDLGLEVGYATRTVTDCLAQAADNYHILLPLLDARFVCGLSPVYLRLMTELKARVIDRQRKDIISWVVARNQDRHDRFGDSAYLLQPNLKEGQGGLRDYHTLLWIARIDGNVKARRDLEYGGYLSQEEYQQLEDALAFIWKVRNRLHFFQSRRGDHLFFDYQIRLADELGYRSKAGQQPVERFLGDLHAHMEFIKQQLLVFLHELGLAPGCRRKRGPQKRTDVRGLKVKDGLLYFSRPEMIVRRPLLLMKVFEESARLGIPLSAEAKRLGKNFTFLVNRDFRRNADVVSSFERILLTPAPTFNVLNEMLNLGLLTRLIPAFKDIVNRIQYDEYHLYPVDKHSLRVVHTIKGFGQATSDQIPSLCRSVYKGMKNKRILLWAALLHDIGKGESKGDHSDRGAAMIARILSHRRIGTEEIDTVAFLVRDHLLLINAATRRDIHDEETAIACARRIKTAGRLKMLYLLTVADSMATGPKAWNEWTSALLRDLFLSVLRILEKGELASREAVARIAAKKEALLNAEPQGPGRDDLADLFDVLSPRYFLHTPAADISDHLTLYRTLGTRDFVWQVSERSSTGTRQVTICAEDRPGLFSKIAGVLALDRLDILTAKVYTWQNDVALDIFKVKPPADQVFEAQKWERIRTNLSDALADRLDLSTALGEMVTNYPVAQHRAVGIRSPKVVVDNQSSSFFTIVEVFTYDFPGLLFCITDALFRCRLDIWVAKIATKVDQVVDVFYVRDFGGQKIDAPDQIEAIQAAIAGVLPGLNHKEINK